MMVRRVRTHSGITLALTVNEEIEGRDQQQGDEGGKEQSEDLSEAVEGEAESRLVTFLRRDVYGQGTATIEIPRFARQIIATRIHARSGKPAYLGTMSPPDELQPDKGEARVWFGFVTATVTSL